MAAAYDIDVLGRVRMRVDGRELRLGGPRQRAVLALLVLARCRPVMADRIMEDVWGDDAFARSRTTLQVYISNLRQELRSAAASVTIESVAGGYVLAVESEAVDLFVAETLLGTARAKALSGDLAGAIAAFEAAGARDGGGILDDLRQFECFSSHVASVEQMRDDASEEYIRCLVRAERYQDAVSAAEGLVARQPLREGAWHQLALALYRLARQSEALRVLNRARTMLDEEVGLDPGPELRELERMILDQAPELGSSVRFPRLRWLDPADGAVRAMPLDDREEVTVGRSGGTDVALVSDRLVSRSHCRLRRSVHGWEVWPDPVAVNGTFVNGTRLTHVAPLRHGDRVRVGETVIVFETDTASGDEPGIDEPTAIRGD